MKPLVSMREALADPLLFGPILSGDSWRPWRILLTAAMGEALTPEERELWTILTGRATEPGFPVEEFWAVVGRRGGKTRSASVLSAYLAALCDWSDCLVPGERGRLVYIGADQKQAGVALGYASSLFSEIALLKSLVTGETRDGIELSNRIDLEIRAASFRGLRSFTAIGVILDEVAFLRTSEDSANPDTEIINALRPALATTSGPLIAISSPYAKRGELFQTHKNHFGPDGDPAILVAHGPSRLFNTSLPQRVVDRAMSRDAASARAEYLGEFRNDIEAFVGRELIEGIVSSGITERPPVQGVEYVGFTDPSGGSSDSWTLAIAHKSGDMSVLDLVHEFVPPFSPAAVAADIASTLARYGLSEVLGDRYGGEFPRELLSNHGIEYIICPAPKSTLYAEVLPGLNTGAIDLLDQPKLVNQLVGLERRVSRGTGREIIDHSPNHHDDVANAACGALWSIDGMPRVPQMGIGSYGGGRDPERVDPFRDAYRELASRSHQ